MKTMMLLALLALAGCATQEARDRDPIKCGLSGYWFLYDVCREKGEPPLDV